MKAYLIARVSTLDQADAIKGQVYKLQDYAISKNYDCELIEVKESAYKKNRKVFGEVIKVLNKDPRSCIVVFDKIDRYTRNSNSHEVMQINDMCRSGKIELHFISDHLFINQHSSASEHFQLNIGISSAQYISESIRDNVKRRQAQMLRDGIWTGAAPFGYRYMSSGGKKWIVPDPFEAVVVAETFKAYASGVTSLRLIAEMWREKYNIPVRQNRIALILKNPFYYGKMRVKDQLYEHNYERLTTYAQFEKVQTILAGHPAVPHRWAGLPYAYRNLIHCEECGCKITFEMKKQKYIYGHCTQAKYKHDIKYINELEFTKQISKILSAIHIPDDVLTQVHQALSDRDKDKAERLRREKAVIEQEIQKYRTRLDKMYEDRLDDKISDEIYEKKYKEYSEFIAVQNERLQTFELLDSSKNDELFHLTSLANQLPSLFENASFDQKRSIINSVLSNLSLKQDLLGWKYKKPFDLMALCNENANWQGY